MVTQPGDPSAWVYTSGKDYDPDEHESERANFGFSTYDWWNFCDYMAWVNIQALEKFKTGHGFPGDLVRPRYRRTPASSHRIQRLLRRPSPNPQGRQLRHPAPVRGRVFPRPVTLQSPTRHVGYIDRPPSHGARPRRTVRGEHRHRGMESLGQPA